MPTNLGVGDEVTFSMRIGGEPVTGSAKVVAAIKQLGNSKVSFSIASMPTADAERFENAIFDSVLARYL